MKWTVRGRYGNAYNLGYEETIEADTKEEAIEKFFIKGCGAYMLKKYKDHSKHIYYTRNDIKVYCYKAFDQDDDSLLLK